MKHLVIADIHGNAEALRAVIANEPECDGVLFLGDSVSPGPQPLETAALLASLDGAFIAGNHDLEMLDPSLTEKWPASWRALNDWTYEELDDDCFDLLRSFKSESTVSIDGNELCLRHGHKIDGHRHAVPNSEDEVFLQLASGIQSQTILFGHSHIQFRRKTHEKEFINPGSVGQNRCGHQMACYGILEEGVFQHRQVEYDPSPWLEAVDRIDPLKRYPEFRDWFKNSLLSGFGIGLVEPWTSFAKQGYF